MLTLVDRAEITRRLMKILDIRNRADRKLGLRREQADLIREYLKMLDLIVPCTVTQFGGTTSRDVVRRRLKGRLRFLYLGIIVPRRGFVAKVDLWQLAMD